VILKKEALMIIKNLIVGNLEENCYIVSDEKTKEAMVIDPGDEPDRIVDEIKQNDLKVNYIICTHAHFDHIGAVGDIKNETGAKVMMHKADVELYENARDQAAIWGIHIDELPSPDVFIAEGDSVKVGGMVFHVIHTPGHSPGGICLYGEGVVFTGDTLFQGSVGRTDFHGGDIAQLKESFRRLLELPDETKVFSGHGQETTIGIERKENFFLDEL
jgi:glyoxylase-like metal-dependent hydrolase (beta-lactamase superfamily II)